MFNQYNKKDEMFALNKTFIAIKIISSLTSIGTSTKTNIEADFRAFFFERNLNEN